MTEKPLSIDLNTLSNLMGMGDVKESEVDLPFPESEKNQCRHFGKNDPVNPNHYSFGSIETIDYIEDKMTNEMIQGYCVGNIIKYVSRYRHKNGKEDLQKAKWYLERLIKNME